jgi:hypothetical protein
MITAFENLQVRPASQRGFDGDAHLARLEWARLYFRQPQVFPSV